MNVMESNPEFFTNTLGMKFVYVPPCTFMMGSPEDEKGRYYDESRHRVTLTQGFYLQTTPVTQSQWRDVMESKPSYFRDCGEDCPVENVSWLDCLEFVKVLNEKEKTGRYRLPSEAEWECACRAGSGTTFCFGDDESRLAEYAWFVENSGLRPHPVGTRKPNDRGLYDMHGNVWEWCGDWHGDYDPGEVCDPEGSPKGSYRIVRGGGWYFYGDSCRSACRNSYQPGYKEFFVGFRLARDA